MSKVLKKGCSEYRSEILGKSREIWGKTKDGYKTAKPAWVAGFTVFSMSWKAVSAKNLNLVRLPLPPLPLNDLQRGNFCGNSCGDSGPDLLDSVRQVPWKRCAYLRIVLGSFHRRSFCKLGCSRRHAQP
jgi:hypothetical protein